MPSRTVTAERLLREFPQDEFSTLVQTRRNLHRHPELAFVLDVDERALALGTILFEAVAREAAKSFESRK